MSRGYVDVPGGKIFWRTVGAGGKTPLLTLHGGPGYSHHLLVDALAPLASDRTIIFYDQLGSGHSDRSKDKDLWSLAHFLEEITILRRALGLEEIVLLGASWGSMLGVDYLLTNPPGVRAAILSNPCLSAPMWKADADRLRRQLPAEIQKNLLEHERNGTTSSASYKAGVDEYNARFVCRLNPPPAIFKETEAFVNHELYEYMWGPSEFFPTGTLKDYDRTRELDHLRLPVLYMCGRFDEATPETTAFYAQQTPGAQLAIIEDASHLALIEQPAAYRAAVRNFLTSLNL